MKIKYTVVVALFVTALSMGVLLNVFLNSGKSSALSGTDFNAGHIIDDAVFTDSGALSATDIQNFLDSQVPNCDTYGAQNVSYYYNSTTGAVNNSSTGTYVTTTRAIYGQRYDTWETQQTGSTVSVANAPYVCLKNYVENPNTGQNNLQNPTASISGGESAAQIIYNAAQEYQINPEVILTTLQKEQGLVTDNWPWTNEYTEAMGYNCPDNGGCSGFAGFYQQVNAAAAQYRRYMNSPDNYNYVVGSNVIDYGVPPPTGSCTTTDTVAIQNEATAALYDYTPYVPDANVLANTNPTGSSAGPGQSVNDACASYGNRNFWWYFNTWFGSSYFTVNIDYDVGDDAVDSTGDIAIIPIRLSSAPLGTVVLNYTVSNPSIAQIVGNSSLTFTTSNWNTDQYITLQGLNSSASSQDFSLEVAYINSPDGTYSQSITPYLNSLPVFWSNRNEMAVYRLYDSTTGQHAYAVSQSVITNLEDNGYTLESTLGYQCPGSTNTPLVVENSLGIVANLTSSLITNEDAATPTIMYSDDFGGILITSLQNSGGTDTVLSSSPAEVSSLEQSGYTALNEFLLCYQNQVPVYRLYDPANGAHFFTESTAEELSSYEGGYQYEGIAFYLNSSDTVPVYRLYDPANGAHFYTATPAEITSAEKSGYQYEGVAFYAGNSSGQVYRLYDPATGIHFWTTSQAELSEVESMGYQYEGIAFYLN